MRDFTLDLGDIEAAIRRAASGRAPRKHWPTRVEPASGPSIGSLFADDALRDRTADLSAAYGRDLVEPLHEIGRENSGFYLLSYRSPAAPGRGSYRRVEVRTTSPELEARARSGYGPRSDGESP